MDSPPPLSPESLCPECEERRLQDELLDEIAAELRFSHAAIMDESMRRGRMGRFERRLYVLSELTLGDIARRLLSIIGIKRDRGDSGDRKPKEGEM